MKNSTKRLLFISMDWYRTKDPKTPLAMASIHANLKANCQSIVESRFASFDLANADFDLKEVVAEINRFKPDFLAWGAYIWNEKYTRKLLDIISTYFPNIKVILGGPQVTFGGRELVNDYQRADFFIKGAGEEPFTWLIDQLCKNNSSDRSKMKEWAVYTPEMIKNEDCKKVFSAPLENLPSPYLSGLLKIHLNQPFVRWETSRGCPYRCNFCQFKSEGRKPLMFPGSRIEQELELFHNMGVQEIHILDPIFNLDPMHYLPIIEKIEALGMKAKLFLQCRLELLLKEGGKEFLEFCKRRENVLLEFGVQTFVEKESKAVLRANINSQIFEALQRVNQLHIPFDIHLIFGLPFQTINDFRLSYETALSFNPQGLYIYPLNLLKGTELEIGAEKLGYEWDTNDYNTLTKSNWMPPEQVIQLKDFSRQVNALAKMRSSTKYPDFPNLKL